ncbi:MAG: tRNA (adenosine(37)-N6)-threonylcarbamoyltransferase complex transferase subunit TsaD [Chlorobi bacterium]|nr:tRNA (adenosine(37)-N6)-threonylcarbamoyltransferase complex transferase subunit TsaD [Chlorobiota bacterium]
MIVLGIETSCDETGVGLVQDGRLIDHVVAKQDIHSQYGGVVPELASRQHIKKIYPALDTLLNRTGITLEEIEGIAITRGPGLIGPLMVGSLFGRGLAVALQKPIVNVNHLFGHIVSVFFADKRLDFPFIVLLASGGHTMLILYWDTFKPEVLGETLDDAAGEAFDKAAVLLGLPYPGGPHIDRLAKQGNPEKYPLPKPQIPGFNFSYSGLKTAFRYLVEDITRQGLDKLEAEKPHLAAAIQKAIIDHLFDKIEAAVEKYGLKRVAIVGGVAANSYFRQRLMEKELQEGWETAAPPLPLCVDNGAMIAMAGWLKLKNGITSPLDESPTPRLPLNEFL